ncbi:MAG: hypothetical protein QNJ97_24910 [Myxococcota bacterium]|nr:hypothetical protein [Myxococcota bacterium]
MHEQPDCPFVGLPTRGIKELETDEPDAQSLSERVVNWLFKAANRLVLTDTRKNARPNWDTRP